MDNTSSHRADGMLLTIFELVTEGVKGTLDDEAAVALGRDVVDNIRHTFGGEMIYVCKGRSLDSILTSNQIWAEFKGNNHVELSKKYDCSVQWVYNVVRTMTRLKRAEVQGDLFDSSQGKGSSDGEPELC